MTAVDTDLIAALKMAKSKKMFFAFVPKGGSDGKLLLSKAKVPAKQIAEAKKEIGGGTPVTGKCSGPFNALVFLVAKPAPPTTGPALKKVVKRDAGLTIDPDIQLAGDADAEEDDGPATKGSFDLAVYQDSRQRVIAGLKALAAKVAGTKHGSAVGVVKEIQSIISRLPASPGPGEIDKLEDYIRHDDTITAAEEVPDHFHDLDIREPLLKAWK
jgi:hypothetical protein